MSLTYFSTKVAKALTELWDNCEHTLLQMETNPCNLYAVCLLQY